MSILFHSFAVLKLLDVDILSQVETNVNMSIFRQIVVFRDLEHLVID